MLELIICDDETVFRKDLRKTLETELDLSGISYKSKEFCCAEDMIKDLCASKDRQIFFLDIEMDKLNGMDAARLIRAQNPSAVIIFVTSYTDFVFQGYEVKALNYILKPYKKEKILEVLHSALKELATTSAFPVQIRLVLTIQGSTWSSAPEASAFPFVQSVTCSVKNILST